MDVTTQTTHAYLFRIYKNVHDQWAPLVYTPSTPTRFATVIMLIPPTESEQYVRIKTVSHKITTRSNLRATIAAVQNIYTNLILPHPGIDSIPRHHRLPTARTRHPRRTSHKYNIPPHPVVCPARHTGSGTRTYFLHTRTHAHIPANHKGQGRFRWLPPHDPPLCQPIRLTPSRRLAWPATKFHA